jgi:hypothetical protein
MVVASEEKKGEVIIGGNMSHTGLWETPIACVAFSWPKAAGRRGHPGCTHQLIFSFIIGKRRAIISPTVLRHSE